MFNKSSWTLIGEVGPRLLPFSMAGHSLPVGGSCRCPQDVHCCPFLAATGWRLSAGVCLVLLPVMLGTFRLFISVEIVPQLSFNQYIKRKIICMYRVH